MNRRTVALLLLAPAALALLQGCGGPLVTAEVKNARITSTNVPFSGTGVPGATTLGDVTADLGPLGESLGSGFVTELTLKRFELAWNDPATRPDFSGVTSATLTVIPDPAAGLPEKVVATYTQDPADPNPTSLVIAGDPGFNLFDFLAGGILTLRLDAQGTLPAVPWSADATAIADLALKVEYSM
jgi:hypothetical protein